MLNGLVLWPSFDGSLSSYDLVSVPSTIAGQTPSKGLYKKKSLVPFWLPFNWLTRAVECLGNVSDTPKKTLLETSDCHGKPPNKSVSVLWLPDMGKPQLCGIFAIHRLERRMLMCLFPQIALAIGGSKEAFVQ